MTQTAQNALRRVIEKYTRNVRFCMICNYASKIIPALQSRCTRFRFAPLKLDQIKSRLDYILEKETTKVTPDGMEAVLKMSQGDMRRALNILQVCRNVLCLRIRLAQAHLRYQQSCHAAYDVTNATNVYLCTGSPLPEDIQRIIEWMMSDEISLAYGSGFP